MSSLNRGTGTGSIPRTQQVGSCRGLRHMYNRVSVNRQHVPPFQNLVKFRLLDVCICAVETSYLMHMR